MKNLHTISTTKYAEALKALLVEIGSDNLSQREFIQKHQLPGNFIKACANLNFIGRCMNGKYTIAIRDAVKDIHGRMISLEIIHIEKIRQMNSKAKNKK